MIRETIEFKFENEEQQRRFHEKLEGRVDMDTSDAAAYALLEKIAKKAVEPMSDNADMNKTLGQCRDELLGLIQEAVSFVMSRNANS